LSSAIATALALGKNIPLSVKLAKIYITAAIESGKDISIGKGNGAVNHFFSPQKLKII
jgi:hydroxymethylpyrimidine/phosphomethylpyrimidine kinase